MTELEHIINGGATAAVERTHAKTINPRRLSRVERRSAALEVYPDVDVIRPQSREDCKSMARPCPFVSCAHHLYLDVNPESGAIKINFPHLEVWEMAETCALDAADRGGMTLEEVGAITNLTRERIRQVEVRGLEKLAPHVGAGKGATGGSRARRPQRPPFFVGKEPAKHLVPADGRPALRRAERTLVEVIAADGPQTFLQLMNRFAPVSRMVIDNHVRSLRTKGYVVTQGGKPKLICLARPLEGEMAA